VGRALELSALTSGWTGLPFASEGRFFSIFVARSRQVIFVARSRQVIFG